MDFVPVKHALISVSDKLGLADFARGLAAAGVEIFSTGGTRKHLEQAGLTVRDIADYTGFPEMMDGRLKTLHPKVHGGILARRDRDDDQAALKKHGMLTFDLVVVNLYPFEATIAREGVPDDEAIEQIDIGGPTMIRAAAKNHRFTAVATSAEQYAAILDQVSTRGGTNLALRRELAAAAFETTARYDRAIADYFAGARTEQGFPASITVQLRRREVLRYGENPHQKAALYAAAAGGTTASLVSARQLHGKELSYNNLLDLDAALTIARSLPDAAAVVIKHNNPCGAASAAKLSDAMRSALAGDPTSAFGGIVGVNKPLDAATADILAGPDQFIEAIIAPEFDKAAIEILTTRPKWKASVRLMQVGSLETDCNAWHCRPIEGGMLMQEADVAADPEAQWQAVTQYKPNDAQMRDLRFAWAVVRHVKSNAIVLATGRMLVGVGAGQMSRVDSTEIAIRKAAERAKGSVLASDAFFPFADSIELAAKAGVSAVIQPGGSKRDDEVIAACNAHGISMIFTGRRHFKH